MIYLLCSYRYILHTYLPMSTTLIVEKKEAVEMELTETTRKENIIKEVLVRKKNIAGKINNNIYLKYAN